VPRSSAGWGSWHCHTGKVGCKSKFRCRTQEKCPPPFMKMYVVAMLPD
jgi:hypothetical protein